MKNLAAVALAVLDILVAAGEKRKSLMVRRLITLASGVILIATAVAFGLAATFLAISTPLGPAAGALLTGVAAFVAGVSVLLVWRTMASHN